MNVEQITLEPEEDMISARESHEYVPFGRQVIKSHPGARPLQLKGSCTDHGIPLVKALKDFSIRETVKVS